MKEYLLVQAVTDKTITLQVIFLEQDKIELMSENKSLRFSKQ